MEKPTWKAAWAPRSSSAFSGALNLLYPWMDGPRESVCEGWSGLEMDGRARTHACTYVASARTRRGRRRSCLT